MPFVCIVEWFEGEMFSLRIYDGQTRFFGRYFIFVVCYLHYLCWK
jgi:hypothetical protein